MKQFNNLTILAIDTSCDDTCIAVVETDKRGYLRGITRMKLEIKSNIVSSQVKLHARYGGVYPTLAKREHQKNLVPVLIQALKGAKLLKTKTQNSKLPTVRPQQFKIQNLEKILKREPDLLKNLTKFLKRYEKPKIDASTSSASTLSDNRRVDLIAVTTGPGLEPCLWTGVNFAKALAYFWQLPIIPVNHIEAHIFANFVGSNSKFLFPAICLVVSGGHTQLILMKNFGKYKILGETRDDAAGECFDKVARILGLGYPGGPMIEKLSKIYYLKSKIYKIKLPRPMINQKNFDFSFSGLKTAVLYDFKNRLLRVRQSRGYIRAMAAEVQRAIVDVLINKTFRAAKEFNAKTIIVGGGVAANEKLRKQFKTQSLKSRVNFFIPPKKFCTDNAAMVGITAFFHCLEGESRDWQKILVNANQRI